MDFWTFIQFFQPFVFFLDLFILYLVTHIYYEGRNQLKWLQLTAGDIDNNLSNFGRYTEKHFKMLDEHFGHSPEWNKN